MKTLLVLGFMFLSGILYYVTKERSNSNEKIAAVETIAAKRIFELKDQKKIKLVNYTIGELPEKKAVKDEKGVRYLFDNNSSHKVFKQNDNDSKIAQDTLVLLGEITPPQYQNLKLQATDIVVVGKHPNKMAYVSYAMIGERFLGAIQILSINQKNLDNPVDLLQTVVFNDFDIHSLSVKNNKIYLAGGTSDESFKTPAVLEILNLDKGMLPLDMQSVRIDLPSYAATSVKKIKGSVVSTTGDDGGVVFIHNPAKLKVGQIYPFLDIPHDYYELSDARYLDADKENVLAVRGTEAGVWLMDRKGKNPPITYNYEGASIAESKSTIQILKDKVLIGVGDGGTQILDLKNNLKLIQKIPQAINSDLDSSKTVTNAAVGWKHEMYTSDGEAGLRAFRFEDTGEANLVASIQFGKEQSVNSINYNNGLLFAASGLGGVKIVKLFRKDKKLTKDEEKYFNDLDDEGSNDDD